MRAKLIVVLQRFVKPKDLITYMTYNNDKAMFADCAREGV